MNTTKQNARLVPGASTNGLHSNFRISAETVKRSAQNRWREILTAVGIDSSILTGKHGPCPACGGRDRFRFIDKNGDGTYFCNQCNMQSGDGFQLMQNCTGKTFTQTLELVASILGISSHSASTQARPATVSELKQEDAYAIERKKAALNAVWEASLEVSNGDPVWRYLTEHRRIKLDSIPECLRFHPALDFYEIQENGKPQKTGTYPAIVSLVSGPDGSAVTLHRTYLSPDATKAPVAAPKKLMPSAGILTGAAIRLYEASDTLGISEGLETGLACFVATGIPTWATISSSLMPSVVIPDAVHSVTIFADNDHAGQIAAKKLAKRLLNEGRRVKLLTPPNIGMDWLDVIVGEVV